MLVLLMSGRPPTLTRTDTLFPYTPLFRTLDALRSRLAADTLSGLLLVDVDDVKQINDGHGHLAGDRVLQAVADELRAAASESDIAFRLGRSEEPTSEIHSLMRISNAVHCL